MTLKRKSLMKQVLYEIKRYIESNHPELLIHLQSVADISISLAKAHFESIEKAELAAWAHDIFRTLNEVEIRLLLEDHRELIAEGTNYLFYHGPLASKKLPKLFNLYDKEILHAISHHTILSKDPTPLEMILFLSDKLDPTKKKKGSEKILTLAHKDLHLALATLLEEINTYNAQKGYPIPKNYLRFIHKFKI